MKIKPTNKDNLTKYTRYNTDVIGTHLLISHSEHNKDKENIGNLVLYSLMCKNVLSVDNKLKSTELINELINRANEIISEYME